MSDIVTRLRSFRARCWGEEGEVIDAALAEIERLRADAARYRWIRDHNNMRARELVQYYGDVEPTELDVAIDMAMLPATPTAPSTP